MGHGEPLAQVVAEAWAELGDAVRPLGKGKPSKRTWSTLFPEKVFGELRRRTGSRLFGQQPSSEAVDPATAAGVRSALLACADLLAGTARWKAAVDRERKRLGVPDRPEAVLTEAWGRTARGLEPDAEGVADLVRTVLVEAAAPARSLNQHLADPAAAADLDARMAQRWSTRDWPGSGPTQQERDRVQRLVQLLDRPLRPGVGLLDAQDDDADAEFTSLVRGTDGTLARQFMARAGATGLSAHSPPPMPVVGRFVRNEPQPAALDRTLAARLGRWEEQNAGTRDDWAEFAREEADRATSALGLAEPSSRVLLCAAVLLARVLHLVPGDARSGGIAGELERRAVHLPSVTGATRVLQPAGGDVDRPGRQRSRATAAGNPWDPAVAAEVIADLQALSDRWIGRRLWNGLARAERLGEPVTSRAAFLSLLHRSWHGECKEFGSDQGRLLSRRETHEQRGLRIGGFLKRAESRGLLDRRLLELLDDPWEPDGRMRRELRTAWAALRAATGEPDAPTARDVVLWLKVNRRR
ncbi:hypothetical protein ACWKWC_04640 [Geodermatophilus nigrescens]